MNQFILKPPALKLAPERGSVGNHLWRQGYGQLKGRGGRGWVPFLVVGVQTHATRGAQGLDVSGEFLGES